MSTTAPPPAAEEKVNLQDVLQFCAIETRYWADVQSEELLPFSMGAMSAASNIYAAIARGITAKAYQDEVARRARV